MTLMGWSVTKRKRAAFADSTTYRRFLDQEVIQPISNEMTFSYETTAWDQQGAKVLTRAATAEADRWVVVGQTIVDDAVFVLDRVTPTSTQIRIVKVDSQYMADDGASLPLVDDALTIGCDLAA
ncbi:Aste57867_7954 [Aphanomyces stellatus]|uniref:Aste57867_7954 protein n=1 Tax=Aphanomyces stellatus TaxID=120398 RepID=A0A485KJ28_9STRA|nr:hypothetical protein As57867_007924 [Aphanomyces stellatus]VFT84847.1 Aste57867_7954 [Aphanomyces stellatus]